MAKGIKIATIGGGSSYTPELMEGFIKRYEELPIREIWLVDVEEGKEKLEIVSQMSQRMWDASPYEVKIYATLDREEALKDADFVTTQFRVGQLDARIKDERIPSYYGMIGQETNGAGGIFKAFRTVPVVLAIVEDMKRLCPNAWLINFANPSGMVTEAVIRYGKWDKVIGLCNVPVMAMMTEPTMLGKKKEELIYKFAGLNHFHWHKVADNKGNDRTAELIDRLYDEDNGLPKNIFDIPFFKEQLKQMNMIPCGYHRYYYREEEMLEHALEEYQTIGTRAQQVKETEAELFELYKDPELDHKPEQLQKRGGAYYSDAACETIASIYGNKETQIVVSTKNDGAVPDLPADCVVEVTAYVGAQGARNVAFGSLPAAERGWLQVMKNMELLTIEAAVTGDYGTALQAFTINPLIRSGKTAKRIMDELFIAHQQYLPQFKETISRLKEEGIKVQDELARELSGNTHIMEEV
ncbi:6-phospho-beta-glucosidase [Enterococcus faecium]|uniref:6-phospho-beta-glucosidase n=1 Tax=Enterococcus faecium TaxID=1352 RepID=UPI0019C57B01|nr:6-phospho-beta-glucosidase [Enterococcus faecium]MCL9978114.1 6-phospho-beta-glucosidase [Enterococcus faecium]MDQ8270256.1 6-phospho-beta-glucosidase [Enterococcus faecium]MEB8308098.1 6-phospho-beta-glucosidase [Enterococcus faecium]NTR72729.1 6-phospho-beta-glucosidase [Enterococcus faecium]